MVGSSSFDGACAEDLRSQGKAAEVDTEHIFGFTEGADIGDKGEQEFEYVATGRFGKPGSYAAVDNETSYNNVVADRFRAGIGGLLDYHDISNVTGVTDRNAPNFNGVSSEVRWHALDRGLAPFGLTLSFAPQWRPIDDIWGEREQSYVLPVTILADVALIPERMFAAFNLSYAPAATRADAGWQREHGVGLSAAVADAIMPGVFLGAEIRYLTHQQSGVSSAHALFVGPSLYVKLSDSLSIKAAWSAHIPDEAAGRLDLVNFERHQARLEVVKNF